MRELASICPFGTKRRHWPAYSITSSAIASTPGGKVTPSALAVFRLITNSNLVDCSMGRSGLAAAVSASAKGGETRTCETKLGGQVVCGDYVIGITLSGRGIGAPGRGHHGGIVGHAGVALDGVGPQQEDLRDDRSVAQSSDLGRPPACLSRRHRAQAQLGRRGAQRLAAGCDRRERARLSRDSRHLR